jgi:hypothetical protein
VRAELWSRCLVARLALIMSVAGIAAVLPAAPGWSAAGDITSVAGGVGSGPALSVGQDTRAVAASRSRIWVLDMRPGGTVFWVRAIDPLTRQESGPLATITTTGSADVPLMPTVAADTAGNAFVAYNGTSGGIVEEVTPSGQTHTVAGGGSDLLFHVDGVPATAEDLAVLNGIAVDGAGNVFVSENGWEGSRDGFDATDSRIRRIGPKGKIATVAGTGTPGLSGDGGKGTAARLNAPMGLAVNVNTGVLFIADTGNHRIRRLTPDGIISTFAGGGTSSADGVPATAAAVSSQSVAFDNIGLVLEDEASCRIRRVTNAHIATVAGGACGWSGDGGPATTAAIFPAGVAAVGGDITFVQDVFVSGGTGENGYVLRQVGGDGTITRYAGSGWRTYGGDNGPARTAQFASLAKEAFDAAGNLYVTDPMNGRLRRIDPSGIITTYAGSGRYQVDATQGDGGPATAATFGSVADVSTSPDGNVYVVDSLPSRIRKVDPSGTITAVAGGNLYGTLGDGGPATEARLTAATAPVVVAGNLVFGDDCRVRSIDAGGTLTTLGGQVTPASGVCADTGDGGPVAAATFGHVEDVVSDAAGDIYVADYDNSTSPVTERVRRIDVSGVVTTVAGGGALTVDGVPATSASIQTDALALDNQGRLLIVEKANGLVRRIESDGTIRTVAGGGTGGDGGPATSASLISPTDVAVDAAGDLFIACVDAVAGPYGGVIREVTAA